MQRKMGFSYQGTVQVGKFSVMSRVQGGLDPKQGMQLPSGLNDPLAFGIVEEGIVPTGASDYNNGSYEGISQAAWPANLQPSTPQNNYRRTVVLEGPIRGRAAGAWNVDDRLVPADNQGHLASVVTLGLAPGTPIWVIATAMEPASNLGDVAQVYVLPHHDVV
jgi:hypothetical protein